MMTEVILEAVYTHYGITRYELTQRSDSRQTSRIVEPKQTAAYLLWRLTRLTNEQIAGMLGYKNKTNIIMCRRAVKEEMERCPNTYGALVKSLESKILRD